MLWDREKQFYLSTFSIPWMILYAFFISPHIAFSFSFSKHPNASAFLHGESIPALYTYGSNFLFYEFSKWTSHVLEFENSPPNIGFSLPQLRLSALSANDGSKYFQLLADSFTVEWPVGHAAHKSPWDWWQSKMSANTLAEKEFSALPCLLRLTPFQKPLWTLGWATR